MSSNEIIVLEKPKNPTLELPAEIIAVSEAFIKQYGIGTVIINPVTHQICLKNKEKHIYKYSQKNGVITFNPVIKNVDYYIDSDGVIRFETPIERKTVKKPKSRKKRTMRGILTPVLLASSILASAIAGVAHLQQNGPKAKNERMTKEALLKERNFIENSKNITISIAADETVELKEETEIAYDLPFEEKYLNIPTVFEQNKYISKRDDVEEEFGETIQSFCSRVGANEPIVTALITQECEDNVKLGNPGQLTKWVCNTKMMLPLIKPSEKDLANNRQVLYIYVFESSEPKVPSEEAQKLKSLGYSIYYLDDLKKPENRNDNIKVSIAYLMYSIQQIDYFVNDGIRAYNGGVSVVKGETTENIMNGKISSGDPYYNIHVYSYLRENEYEDLYWYIKKIPTKWMKQDVLTPEQLEQLNQQKITLVNQSFPNMKGKVHEKNGYSR